MATEGSARRPEPVGRRPVLANGSEEKRERETFITELGEGGGTETETETFITELGEGRTVKRERERERERDVYY